MKFQTHNDNDLLYKKVSKSSLKGYLDAPYHRLVEEFGEPETDWDKSSAHWVIETEGEIITIYDYCEGNFAHLKSKNWHVGGHSMKALEKLDDLLMVLDIRGSVKFQTSY